MTAKFLEFSEAEVLNELKTLMLNERIRPEPEYEFFSKYFAASPNENFTEDEGEILHLINSHGVHLRNDVKYWLNKSNVDNSNEEVRKLVPVLNPEHFRIEHFSDVIEKLKELPSEWTVVQITKKFSVEDATGKQEIPELHLTRFACGDLADRISPYSVLTENRYNTQENIFKVLQSLSEMRKEYYNLGRSCKKLYEAYYKTNSELESFIKELELYVLGEWICLLQGRLEDSKLETETLAQVRRLVQAFCKKEDMEVMPDEQRIDVVYHITLVAHLLKNKAMFNALRLVLYTGGRTLVNVNELVMLVEDIKMLNLSNSCAVKRARREPLILILDNEFEMVPWEMTASLYGQPVCRISSLHLLYALYKYHEPHITKGLSPDHGSSRRSCPPTTSPEAVQMTIEIDCAYCLINPGQDLKDCEKDMKDFLRKRIPWAEMDFGKAPEPKDLMSKIEGYSAYLYCGHGSGMQYLKARDLKKAFVKGLILLFGCSSNIPKNCGGRTPHQNHTYTYISNGCPCIIGCIQDLGSTDADAACKEMLSNLMPSVGVEGGERTVQEPKEPNVLRALAAGKLACPKYWSKSAFVARGLPCRTVVGDVNAIVGINSL